MQGRKEWHALLHCCLCIDVPRTLTRESRVLVNSKKMPHMGGSSGGSRGGGGSRSASSTAHVQGIPAGGQASYWQQGRAHQPAMAALLAVPPTWQAPPAAAQGGSAQWVPPARQQCPWGSITGVTRHCRLYRRRIAGLEVEDIQIGCSPCCTAVTSTNQRSQVGQGHSHTSTVLAAPQMKQNRAEKQ